MNYPRHLRYRRVEDMQAGYFEEQQRLVASDKDSYPKYHIAPHCGLLNDPNGLVQWNAWHHIFYQYHPIAPTHGLKYWYHVSTQDFVHYNDHGIALKPDTALDSHGVYSGGALVDGDDLLLFFTGNHFTDEWIRDPKQAYVRLHADGSFSEKRVIIPHDPEFTEHFRDPKPWKAHGGFYCILGAQTQPDTKGAFVLYHASQLHLWQKVGVIQTAFQSTAYMFECPDYFELSGQGVLLFCPQGEPTCQNPSSVVYSLSSPMDLHRAIFDGDCFFELDKGFDFYAPQTYLDQDNRRILIAWLGMADAIYPYDEETRWSQMLTIPRELSIRDSHLIQTPLPELKQLRQAAHPLKNGANPFITDSFEIEIQVEAHFQIRIENALGENLCFHAAESYVLDRGALSKPIATSTGSTRCSVRQALKPQTMTLFFDRSCLEIFLDDGATVFSSRVFVTKPQTLRIAGLINGYLFPMKAIQYHPQPSHANP